jgi:hypothetical protein
VSWNSRLGKWVAQIQVDSEGRSKKIHLGVFDDELEAARAAREARTKLMPYSNTIGSDQ